MIHKTLSPSYDSASPLPANKVYEAKPSAFSCNQCLLCSCSHFRVKVDKKSKMGGITGQIELNVRWFQIEQKQSNSIAPRSFFLQLKMPGYSTTNKYTNTLKLGRRRPFQGITGNEVDTMMKHLGFLQPPISWTGHCRSLQPGTSNKYRPKKTPRKAYS